MSAQSAKPKFAIIGAGPVGLSAARALKQKGIEYEQFESGTAVGGNWRDGVYQSAHIISSRKTTEFPDYPMPSDYPDFPSANQMLAYLNDYAKHYDLLTNITFNKTVELVSPLSNEFFELRFSDGTTSIHEGVVVCNGHHRHRRFPQFEGQFTGELIHSKDYKDPDQIRGKRVLVIGGGNSSCDITAEAARVGASAHMSLRRGYWFMPKTFYGVPTSELLTTKLPVWMQRIYFTMLLRVVVGDYRSYGLMKPDHKIFEHHPTINTEVLHYLKHGRIVPHPDVKRLDGRRVEFVDGMSEDFDVIVCGTGFYVSFPFLAPGLIETDNAVVKVRWGMVAPNHKHLYIYGWGQVRYGFGPLLTPGSDILADLILLQRKLRHPLGQVLEKLKQPFPRTHLLDPMATLRQIESVRGMLWIIPLVDKYLMKNAGSLRSSTDIG
ncbi:MAG: NAD(P)-binding domain-containing protein [Candidatus Melainabacteria bacterium]|nr:NAD(P)-binding domain-containing protein [Candidatus Melainabacteria bacterium]